jgi:methionyl-tRNA formyltransferase
MATPKISLYFMGTDAFASVVLKRLADDSLFEVRGVVVPPDRPVGRKQVMTPCPTKVMAEELGLGVLYEPKDLIGKDVDFFVVASYGRILSEDVLNTPKYASVNLHCSLLPMYRGASPIQAALLHGDKVSGVCLQRMVKKLDAGGVYSFSEFQIRKDHNAENMREEMSHLAAEIAAQALPGIMDGSIESLDQDESSVSYSPKIERSSGEIQWDSESAPQVHNKMRAYTPWPGIYTLYDGKRLKLLDVRPMDGSVTHPGKVVELEGVIAVETFAGLLELKQVQIEGKNPMNVSDFVRGYPDFVGTVLG